MEPRAIKRVCVYAGSRAGARPSYLALATSLGQALARRGIAVVYGGGKTGLMGAMADGVIEAGGEIVGIMPRMLVDKEIAHGGLRDLRVTDSMHERKKMMVDLADAFIALPGGFGTFDELFEVLTWAQIGLHDRPIGLLSVDGYFDPFVALANHVGEAGFAAKEHASLYVVRDDPNALIDALLAFTPPPLGDGTMDRRAR